MNDTKNTAEIITKDNKRYIKTAKGTELPLLILKGKDYLQVAHRLVWFREDHPDWSIIPELYDHNTEKYFAIFRAEIQDSTGRIIAKATKLESVKGFGDYLEKAETGAIGRALALCGYGTQHAPEFDEEERLADSPVDATKKEVAPEISVIPANETAPKYDPDYEEWRNK